MSEPLKPCPFCGGEAILVPDDCYGSCMIYCGACDLSENGVEAYAMMPRDRVQEAIAAWNRRADSGLRDDEREPWPGNPPSPYPALDRFAASMRARLVENRHKGGWQEMTPMECYSRAMDEMAELIRAIASADHSLARHEAADAANFLMMLDHALAPIAEGK